MTVAPASPWTARGTPMSLATRLDRGDLPGDRRAGPDPQRRHYDAFVAKVNAAGTALVYCGYIGGSGDDYGQGIAVDSSGNAYVAGDTVSTEATFPVTGGPDLTHNGGTNDAFVAKVVSCVGKFEYRMAITIQAEPGLERPAHQFSLPGQHHQRQPQDDRQRRAGLELQRPRHHLSRTDSTTCGGTDNCTLDHEIEKYDPATGNWWPGCGSLDYQRHGDLRLLRKLRREQLHAACLTAVWDASFKAVWHLSNDSVCRRHRQRQYRDELQDGQHRPGTDPGNASRF